MALKNNWKDLVDGESFVEVDPINRMAHAIIANEENILSVQKSSESIQAENKSQEAKINELSKGLTRFENDAVKLDSKINENEKRIINLEKGIPSDLFLTDSSIAYSKNVPQNALPYAEIRNIGGMTRKCTNLTTAQAVYKNAVQYLETVVDGRNCVRMTSGASLQNTPFMFKGNTQYTASFYTKVYNYDGAKDGNIVFQFWYTDGTSNTLCSSLDETSWTKKTITSEAGKTVSAIGVGAQQYQVYNYIDIDTFMLNEGSEPLPYEPYFEGLRSAPVTEVESVGANLFNIDATPSWNSNTKSTLTKTDDVTLVSTNSNATGGGNGIYVGYFPAGATLTISGYYAVSSGSTSFKSILSNKNATSEANINVHTSFGYSTTPTYFEHKATIKEAGNYYFRPAYSDSYDASRSVTLSHIQINKGTEALPYRPYTRNTLPIPESVQALDGYGDGVNESVYNYIDLEKKQFVKRVGKVDLGTLNWVLHDGTLMLANASENPELILAKVPQSASNHTGPFVSSVMYANRPWTRVVARTEDKVMSVHGGNSGGVIAYDTSYTDAATFKAALAGVMLYYELATPVVTDISDLVSEDNFIGVEGNGTVTMINQYKYNVPSEIVFMLDEV